MATICYNEGKVVIVNIMKQMLNKYLDLPEVYVNNVQYYFKNKVSKLKKNRQPFVRFLFNKFMNVR